jgi:ketosteroid isomerase-like protein
MGQHEVEAVRSLYPPGGIDWAAILADRASEEAFVDRVLPKVHPDYEVAWTVLSSSGERTRVVARLRSHRTALRNAMRGFERFCITPECFVDLGDRVMVMARLDGRTKDGDKFTGEGGAIFTFADGKLRRLEEYMTRDELFAAAGLTREEATARAVDA